MDPLLAGQLSKLEFCSSACTVWLGLIGYHALSLRSLLGWKNLEAIKYVYHGHSETMAIR